MFVKYHSLPSDRSQDTVQHADVHGYICTIDLLFMGRYMIINLHYAMYLPEFLLLFTTIFYFWFLFSDWYVHCILLLFTCWHIELNISIIKSNALRNLFFHGFVMDTCVCLSIKREVWFLVTKCGEFHYVLTKQSLSIQC